MSETTIDPSGGILLLRIADLAVVQAEIRRAAATLFNAQQATAGLRLIEQLEPILLVSLRVTGEDRRRADEQS